MEKVIVILQTTSKLTRYLTFIAVVRRQQNKGKELKVILICPNFTIDSSCLRR